MAELSKADRDFLTREIIKSAFSKMSTRALQKGRAHIAAHPISGTLGQIVTEQLEAALAPQESPLVLFLKASGSADQPPANEPRSFDAPAPVRAPDGSMRAGGSGGTNPLAGDRGADGFEFLSEADLAAAGLRYGQGATPRIPKPKPATPDELAASPIFSQFTQKNNK